MKKIAAFLSTLLISSTLLAEVTNFTISGYSNYDEINSKVYGSFAGPENPAGNGDIYNSCDVAPSGGTFALGCNTDRVSLSTTITVTFSETSEFTGSRQAVVYLDDSDGNAENKLNISSSTVTGPNQNVSVNFEWTDVCSKLSDESPDPGNDECSGNGVMDIFFGIEDGSGGTVSQRSVEFTIYTPHLSRTSKPIFTLTDYPNTATDKACETSDDISNGLSGASYFGMCDFEAAPGDEKATLINQSDSLIGHGLGIFGSADTFDGSTESSINDTFNIDFKGVVICHSTLGFDQTLPWLADNCNLLEFESAGVATIDDDEIDGLTNGTTSYFRGATIDIANNVTMLFSDATINAYCGSTTTLGSQAAVDACPFAATPQLVVGLISETKCFITTATYGSEQAHQVKLFRDFRREFLWTNSLGLFISRTYNSYGPIAANWIYKNPWSKKLVRIGLYPLYWFAWSSLKVGFFASLIIFTLFGLVSFVSLKRLVRIVS